MFNRIRKMNSYLRCFNFTMPWTKPVILFFYFKRHFIRKISFFCIR